MFYNHILKILYVTLCLLEVHLYNTMHTILIMAFVFAVYGYGTLAVLVESLCALLGLIIIKFRKTAAYKYILTVMLGLSVSTMCGDAILHLIPKVCKANLYGKIIKYKNHGRHC